MKRQVLENKILQMCARTKINSVSLCPQSGVLQPCQKKLKVQPESARSTFLVRYFPLLNRFSIPDLFSCETCYGISQTKFMGGIRLPSDVINIFFIQVPISKIKK